MQTYLYWLNVLDWRFSITLVMVGWEKRFCRSYKDGE